MGFIFECMGLILKIGLGLFFWIIFIGLFFGMIGLIFWFFTRNKKGYRPTKKPYEGQPIVIKGGKKDAK